MDLSKLTPAPWIATEAIEWHPKQRGSFTDRGAFIMHGDRVVVEGGLQDEQGGAVGVLKQVDAEFIALARNAFDVMMRRGWGVVWIGGLVKKWGVDWNLDNVPPRFHDLLRDAVVSGSLYADDPITAIIESDRWYAENVDAKEKP